jgi:hypothetical protein
MAPCLRFRALAGDQRTAVADKKALATLQGANSCLGRRECIRFVETTASHCVAHAAELAGERCIGDVQERPQSLAETTGTDALIGKSERQQRAPGDRVSVPELELCDRYIRLVGIDQPEPASSLGDFRQNKVHDVMVRVVDQQQCGIGAVNRRSNLTPHRRPILTPLRGELCW